MTEQVTCLFVFYSNMDSEVVDVGFLSYMLNYNTAFWEKNKHGVPCDLVSSGQQYNGNNNVIDRKKKPILEFIIRRWLNDFISGILFLLRI